MTRDQALAFVEALVGNSKMKAHLSAILGYEAVPSVADFSSHKGKAVDHCGDLITYLKETIGIIEVLHKARPRQEEIKLKEKKDKGEWDPSVF